MPKLCSWCADSATHGDANFPYMGLYACAYHISKLIDPVSIGNFGRTATGFGRLDS